MLTVILNTAKDPLQRVEGDMDHNRKAGTVDGRIEQAKDAALGAHHGPPSTADEIGEAAGGVSGTVLGASAGTAAGPLGSLIGGIVGAISGWWAGRAVTEAAEKLADADEEVRHPQRFQGSRVEREVPRTVADEITPRRPDERRR
jgi:outer membrane lipoprotein SlyB